MKLPNAISLIVAVGFIVAIFLTRAGWLENHKTTSLEKSLDTKVIADVKYGNNPAQSFDVYIPKNVKDAQVILIYLVAHGVW